MKKEFEKHAKEELSQQEVHVDVEALWENVAPHVQKKKKRNFLLWFWTVGLSILLTSVGLWLAFGQNTEIEKESHHSTISTEKTSTEAEADIAVDAIVENEMSKTGTRDKTSKSSVSETNVNHFTEVKETKTINHLPKGKSLDQQKIEKRNPNSTATIVDPTAANVIEDDREVVHLVQGLNVGSTFVEKVKTKSDNPEETKTSNLKNTPSLQKISKLNLPTMTMETILLNESVLENVDQKEPSPYESAFPRRPSKESKIKYGIGLYGSIGLIQTTLDAVDGLEWYQGMREESEKDLEHLQLGISGIVKIKNKFSLRTGLEYNRLASKFDRQVSDSVIDSMPNGVTEMFVNLLTNDTIFGYGLVVNSQSTFINKQTYNYFHQIDIPVLIGYQLNQNEWSIGVEAGAIINLTIRRKGEIFKTDGRYYNLKKNRSEWYKKRLGITPLLQLNVAYQLSVHFQIHASPYYRFKSIYSTTSNPIQEKKSAIGLQFGGRYLF